MFPRAGLLAALVVTGCEGQIAVPQGPPTPSEPCQPVPLAWGLRRLAHDEYDRTVRDMLEAPATVSRGFPSRGRVLGFSNNIAVLGVDEGLAERYLIAAEQLAPQLLAKIRQTEPCDLAVRSCVEKLLHESAKLAWRGDVAEDELASLVTTFEAMRAANLTDLESLEGVVSVILNAPRFLYRVESQGQALSAWDLANRLSYFALGTMPDATLREKARSGAVLQRDVFAAEARRLITDPRADDVLMSFYRQWLGVDELEAVQKSPMVSTNFSALAHSLREEVGRAAVDAHRTGGSVSALFESTSTFVDAALAEDRALPPVAAGQWVKVPNTRPGGVVTLQGVMAAEAHAAQSSPTRRGAFIRRAFFCQEPPPPPPGLVVTAPDPDPTLTTRERFAAHASGDGCAGCHRLMDPVGLSLEHFDAVGRWRETENGLAIDDRGEFFSTDVDGPFSGAAGLAAKLDASAQVRQCVAAHWVRFASGHAERTEDTCTISHLAERLRASPDDALIELITSPAFMSRAVEAAP